jgi:NAD(P)-dependent dehydrogenase (short-subunit alcohol dehydrogenase family)
MEFKNKRVLITGGGRGIGRGLAVALAERGASVAVMARTAGQLEDTVRRIESAGGKGLVCTGDVSREEDAARAAAETVSAFGGIDILVNNAGIGGPADPVHTTPLDGWNETIAVNLTGVFLMCKAVIPVMIKNRSGKILNVASTAGKAGVARISPYCASKFGVIGLTQSLAKEVAELGICVNSLCPGPTETSIADSHWPMIAESGGITIEELRQNIIDQTPQKRILTVDDVVGAALFLLSPQSDAITGEELIAAGGYKGI